MYVVVGADREHWPGVIGVINSVVANSAQSSRLRILALAPDSLKDAFRTHLKCHGLRPITEAFSDAQPGPVVRVAGFASSRVPPLKVRTKLTNLESPLNFARFYLHELLPRSAHKVLYLDADTIVHGDAVELYDAALPHDELCAATLRKQTLGAKGVASLKGDRLQKRFRERYHAKLPLHEHGFNAGVFVFNLRAWAELNLTSEVEHWIRANNAEQLYALGSQPPLTLSILGARHATGRCQPLPSEWHLDCLGCLGAGRLKTAEQLSAAKLYHWNGPNKPWPTPGRVGRRGSSKRPHAELFDPYAGRGAQCES